jgi:hypothetical protein
VVTEKSQHSTQVVERAGLAELVTEMPSGLDSDGMPGDGVGPRAVVQEEPVEASGQGNDAGVLAIAGGVVQPREEAGALGPGPGQRLLRAGQDRQRRRDRVLSGGPRRPGLA